MKKVFILLFILGFYNCGSSKTILNEIQEFINSQNFTIIKPTNWRPVKDHQYVSYTPLKRSSNFFDNKVSVFKFRLKNKPSFDEFAKKQFKLTNKTLKNITTQKFYKDKNHLGNVYVHKLESTWYGKTYQKHSVYFENNGEYYYYNYTSLKHIYQKHFEEANLIFQSIKFKE